MPQIRWRYIKIAIPVLIAIIGITMSCIVSQEQTDQLKKMNDHGDGPQDVQWVIPATDGWKIDTSSIKVKLLSKSKRSQYEGVTFKSESHFIIEGRLINHGILGRA